MSAVETYPVFRLPERIREAQAARARYLLPDELEEPTPPLFPKPAALYCNTSRKMKTIKKYWILTKLYAIAFALVPLQWGFDLDCRALTGLNHCLSIITELMACDRLLGLKALQIFRVEIESLKEKQPDLKLTLLLDQINNLFKNNI